MDERRDLVDRAAELGLRVVAVRGLRSDVWRGRSCASPCNDADVVDRSALAHRFRQLPR